MDPRYNSPPGFDGYSGNSKGGLIRPNARVLGGQVGCLRFLAGAQLVIGILLLAGGITAVALGPVNLALTILGGMAVLWCPLGAIAAGGVGLFLTRRNSRDFVCVRRAFQIMSLMNALVFMVILALVAGLMQLRFWDDDPANIAEWETDFMWFIQTFTTSATSAGRDIEAMDDMSRQGYFILACLLVGLSTFESALALASACIVCCGPNYIIEGDDMEKLPPRDFIPYEPEPLYVREPPSPRFIRDPRPPSPLPPSDRPIIIQVRDTERTPPRRSRRRSRSRSRSRSPPRGRQVVREIIREVPSRREREPEPQVIREIIREVPSRPEPAAEPQVIREKVIIKEPYFVDRDRDRDRDRSPPRSRSRSISPRPRSRSFDGGPQIKIKEIPNPEYDEWLQKYGDYFAKPDKDMRIVDTYRAGRDNNNRSMDRDARPMDDFAVRYGQDPRDPPARYGPDPRDSPARYGPDPRDAPSRYGPDPQDRGRPMNEYGDQKY